MIFSQFNNIRISAISAAVSKNIQRINDLKTNEDERVIDQFIKKTGIVQIHKAPLTQTASDFGYSAAKLIEAKGYYIPEEIGVLVNITQNPDYRTPSTACVLQNRLGLKKSCIAFDVNLGCSGFVYGVTIAASLLQSSNAKKALIIIGDTLARGRKKEIPGAKRYSNTALLFGDASSAVLIERCVDSAVYSGLMTDGSGHKALSTPYGAWKHPEGPEAYPGDDIAVFNFTISEVPSMIKEFLLRTKTDILDYDALVLHQANMMIMKQIARKVKMPMEKVPVSLDRFGNTSGASVPLTIVDQYGNENDGKTLSLLASGYGVGLSWGVVSFKIKDTDILPLCISNDIYEDGYEEGFKD